MNLYTPIDLLNWTASADIGICTIEKGILA